MGLTLIFWLALTFSGAVIVRHVFPKEYESGPMGIIALGFMASAAVLSPVSILCYVLQLPVAVFSTTCVLLLVFSIGLAFRRRYWADFRSLLVSLICVETLFVVGDIFLGAKVGGFLSGDAQVHLARIRFILVHGFSNQDPFIEVPGFFATYHTNLWHALQAACTQLTGSDYLGAWAMSWVWVKLLVVAAGYYLAWSVFRDRWAAWTVGLFSLFLNSTISFAVYPNQFSINILVPMAIAFVVQVCRSSEKKGPIIGLAATTLVMGQFHGLYAGFIALTAGPAMTVVLFRKVLSKQLRWSMLGLALGSLLLGTPFSLIAKYVTGPSSERVDAPLADDDSDEDTAVSQTAMTKEKKRENEKFHALAGGMLMHKPELVMGRRPFLALFLIIAGATCTLVGDRRREGLIVLYIWATVVAILFVPPICTLTIKAVGQKWVLGRIGGIMSMCLWVMVVGGFAYLIRNRIPRWWQRAILSALIVVGATQFHRRSVEYSWPIYWKIAWLPEETRRLKLNQLREASDRFAELLTPGEVVLTDGRSGRKLVMLADCHILAPDRSSPGASAHPSRRRDLKAILEPGTPTEERIKLLDKYNITHVLATARMRKSVGWIQQIAVGKQRVGQTVLVRIDTNK